MPSRTLHIGTRGSQLALRQTNWVIERLQALAPDLQIETIVIKTRGDVFADVPMARIEGKGVFVKEIENALLSNEIDLAVHSLKDMPTELPAALAISALPERADPRDVLVSHHPGLAALPKGARLGTSSLRRIAQIKAYRPDLQFVALRGNLDTRLRKAAGGELDGVILAAAGLHRLGLEDKISEYLPIEVCLPAAGQGALAVETRADDKTLQPLLAALDHPPTRQAIEAERSFLAALGGGCQVPIAAYGQAEGDRLTIHGVVAAPDGSRLLRGALSGPAAEAETLGARLAQSLIEQGAAELLVASTA